MKILKLLLISFVLLFLGNCNENKVEQFINKEKATFNLFDSIDSKSKFFNFIKVPIIENYRLKDSFINDKHNLKIYHFHHKGRESENGFYSVIDTRSNEIFILANPYYYCLGKYYRHLQVSDLNFFPYAENPKYIDLYFKDIERFLQKRYNEKNTTWKSIIELNDEIITFYYKEYFDFGRYKVTNIDSIYCNQFTYRDIDTITNKKPIKEIVRLLSEKIKSPNVQIFNTTGFMMFELVRDENDTLNKTISLNVSSYNVEYFLFKRLIEKQKKKTNHYEEKR